MKKKIFLALVIMAIFTCLFAIGASAVVVDGLDYTFTASTKYEGYDGTAELNTGNKTTASGDIVIPESVTSDGKTYLVIKIGNNAFQNNKNITSVTIPASVTAFGQGAFNGASNLTKSNYLGTIAQWCTISTGTDWAVHSPTQMSKNLYINDVLVTDLVIPEGVTKVNDCLFVSCWSLESVSFPSTMTTIARKVFYDCKNIKTVTYAGTLEDWCEKVSFGNSSSSPILYSGDLKTSDYPNGLPANLVLPESVTKINAYMLSGCSFTSVEMTDNVKTVGNGIFYGCTSLTTVKLTNSINSVPSMLFSGCTSLSTFNFPTSPTSIGSEAFKNCTSLPEVMILPSTIKTIGTSAFENCTSIKYIKFPASLTEIAGTVFRSCTGLEFADFGESTNLTKFTAYGVFLSCSSLKALSLPDSLAEISERAFNSCQSLQAVYLPSGLVKMGTNGSGQGPFCNNTNMYFVNTPFTVSQCVVDGEFDSSKFVMPEKPKVYFFPSNFTTISGHTEENSNASGKAGTLFKGCTNINDVLVFSENFVNFNVTQAFYYMSTSTSQKTVVFLGDIQKFVTPTFARYTQFVFANENDTSLNDLNVVRVNKNIDRDVKINEGSYMYFCASETKCDYSTLSSATADATAIANYLAALVYENEAHHVRNPLFDTPTDPTCTVPGSIDSFCFCDSNKQNKLATEEIPALGHDKDKELSYNVWVWENDNYFENAKYKHVCQVCGVEYLSEEYIENSYLFVKEGFATFANKDGETIKSYDFQYSIKVNTDAMDNYTVATGKVIKYGTVAGVGNSVANPISYENGTLTVGASAAVSDMTGTDYVKLLIKVTSIPVLEEGVKITCNAYAIVDDKLRYIGDGNVGEVAFTSVIK